MTTAQGSAEYGFGLFIDSLEAQPRIGHTGGRGIVETVADRASHRAPIAVTWPSSGERRSLEEA
jgi:hypothetical protein